MEFDLTNLNFKKSGQLVQVLSGVFKDKIGIIFSGSITINGKYQVHFEDNQNGLCSSHNLKLIGFFDKRSNNSVINSTYDLSEEQLSILKGKKCPYCKEDTQYVDSSIVYGKSYGMIYFCSPCDAYVGVHKGTDNALGRLANAELRYWKKLAHEYFDKLWQNGILKRKQAYQKLSDHLGIPPEYTHIGMFSVETCKKVVLWSEEILKNPNLK